MANFRYFHHPRNAMALIRANFTDGVAGTALKAQELGLTVANPEELRETLFTTANLAAAVFAALAAQQGRAVDEVLDEWAVAIELSIPPDRELPPQL